MTLSECARAIKGRTPSPILSCVQLGTFKGTLIARATNTNVWVERVADCDGELEPCCVNHGLLSRLLELSTSEFVTLALGKRLEVKGDSTSNINILAAEEFPRWPDMPAEPLAVNTADLADGMEAVSWATIDERAGRPALENTCINLTPKMMECIGFMGNMFAMFARPAIGVEKEFRVHSDFTPALVAALRQPESNLLVSDNFAMCAHKFGRTAVKLSDLQFVTGWRPFFERYAELPFARVDINAMKAACARAMSMWSKDYSPGIRIAWENDTLTLESNGDVGDYKQVVTLGDDVGDGAVYLNASYLHQALSKMSGDKIRFTPDNERSFWRCGDLTVVIAGMAPPAKDWKGEREAVAA